MPHILSTNTIFMKKIIYSVSVFAALMLTGCNKTQESVEPTEGTVQTSNEFGASCIQCVAYVKGRIPSLKGDLTTYTAKKNICNAWTPKAGYAVIMPSPLFPDYGHIAYVAKVVDASTLIIDEANWGKACAVTTGVTIKISKRGVYGYYKP